MSSDQIAVTIEHDVIVCEIAQTVAIATGTPAYVFTQDAPSDLWTIAHGLNDYPSVTVVDTLGRLVEADVAYLDRNTVTVAFANAATGQAFLN